MGSKRFISIDPEGVSTQNWLYVVVEAETGICYLQQYGGTACRQGHVEGFLVPLFSAGEMNALAELFEKDFGGAGTWNHTWPDDKANKLREIVGAIRYWTSDEVSDEPHALRLDESRWGDVDEAWVPVITPDGPGVLLWFNSD
ncbi:DUF6210 family protein [Allokutzneria sp. NRRL B-24872]|uniref:DUF6210 family protein n=1 Tax=Allokutzneria sp. NRRL B-24872 TaxID=1137961 RepID=UPI000A361FDC|nr:DUF6210 family protein [Allokutzneria sp. NRRL B-24872]